MTTMDDPGSLQNLNDIVEPAAVAWWPPAPGWYLVLAVLVIVTAWGCFRWIRARQRNRYRREALKELAAIRTQGASAAAAIPPLLKRAALSAWPREQVAGLVGGEWHVFLDRQVDGAMFEGRQEGAWLDRLAYAASAEARPSPEEFDRLLSATQRWLKRHRAPD